MSLSPDRVVVTLLCRVFLRCPKPRDEGQCDYFQWEDELSGTQGASGGPKPSQSPPLKGSPAKGGCFKCGEASLSSIHYAILV